MLRSRTFSAVGSCYLVISLLATPLLAEQPADQKATYEKMVASSLGYLRNNQSTDGSYSRVAGPAVTALVTTAMLKHGVKPDDPLAQRSLKFLEGFVREDGGIYNEGSPYRNYETCLAVLCFDAANEDGRYRQILIRADAFLKDLQWDESEGKSPSDFAYGGQGYGKHKRADASNTSFFVDAAMALGNNADSEAIQNALLFLSRCQNLESTHNKTPFAAKNPDGGFYYTPDNGGHSQALKTPGGGLRSYGSMTYAGLKSMIYAGVGKDDPRVKAAIEWIRKHYSLKQNPGMGRGAGTPYAGLYYYYHMFAKALDALGEDTFTDAAGKQHHWRAELIQELAQRQQPDGSWLNEQDSRWMEDDQNLVTGYALLTLVYCR